MTDQHLKGAVSSAKGTVKEGVGKLTGDKKLEAKGKAQKVQGKAQNGLGDVEDAVRTAGHADPWRVTAATRSLMGSRTVRPGW